VVLKIGKLNKEVSIASVVSRYHASTKERWSAIFESDQRPLIVPVHGGQCAFTTVVDRLGGGTGLAQTHVAIPSLLGNPGN
jgi:hypothetical protein